MSDLVKRIVKQLCPDALLHPVLRFRSGVRNWRYVNTPVVDIFTQIYQNRSWGGASVSGMGSDVKQTCSVRQKLPELLANFSVRTLLDLPCGDFNWMQHTPLGDYQYIGADIVPELVANNNARYGSAKTRFCVLDLIKDELPVADLMLCRDCLIHLSFKDARSALLNVARSNISYLLTTTYPLITRNSDIVTGDFRAINLELMPFNFPKPMRVIPEDLFPGHKENPNFVRQLGLWSTSDIKQSLIK
jgi:hypothetical protein